MFGECTRGPYCCEPFCAFIMISFEDAQVGPRSVRIVDALCLRCPAHQTSTCHAGNGISSLDPGTWAFLKLAGRYNGRKEWTRTWKQLYYWVCVGATTIRIHSSISK